jgi:tRNA-binding protein
MTPDNEAISIDDFARVDIRAGVIVAAEPFPEARKAAYRLRVDCGPDIGVKRSSAQIIDLYQPDDLIGMRVMAVVNLPPRQIGPMMSEILVLGFHDPQGRVVLAQAQGDVIPGARLC